MKKLDLNQMEVLEGGKSNPVDCGLGLAGLAIAVVGAAAIVTTGGAALFAAGFILGSIGTARSC